MTDPNQPRQEIVDDPALEVREAMSDRLSGLWWTFVLRGALALIVGIAALFWPTGSIALLIQIVGVLLVLDGLLTVFGLRNEVGRVGTGAGILTLIIGAVLILWPEGTVKFGFFLLGAWAAITGIASLMTWREMPDWDPERDTARNTGILALIVGLVLIFWPGTGMVALGWAIAFAALGIAAVMFWLAARFRKAKDRVAMKTVGGPRP